MMVTDKLGSGTLDTDRRRGSQTVKEWLLGVDGMVGTTRSPVLRFWSRSPRLSRGEMFFRQRGVFRIG